MEKDTAKSRPDSVIPAPLRRANFRQLWLGMASSYAGDRFQQLAQAWLVATLTSSALAVGWIATLGSIPLLFMPLGGVIADLVDRRRLLITWQIIGAAATAIVLSTSPRSSTRSTQLMVESPGSDRLAERCE